MQDTVHTKDPYLLDKIEYTKTCVYEETLQY